METTRFPAPWYEKTQHNIKESENITVWGKFKRERITVWEAIHSYFHATGNYSFPHQSIIVKFSSQYSKGGTCSIIEVYCVYEPLLRGMTRAKKFSTPGSWHIQPYTDLTKNIIYVFTQQFSVTFL